MLLTLGWPSLYLRRKRARLVLMFKFFQYLLISPEYLPTPSPVTTTRANHNFKIFIIKQPLMLTSSHFFQEQSPNGIIYLHIIIVNEQTLNSFKQSLYQYFNL